MSEPVIFLCNDPYSEYKVGETGILVGFCRGGNDIPYGIVRLESGLYVMAALNHIKYNG